MYVTALDLAAVGYLVLGTLVIKRLLREVYAKKLGFKAFVLITLPLGVVPALAMQLNLAPYSAVGVVAAGVTLFWFAILCARGQHGV